VVTTLGAGERRFSIIDIHTHQRSAFTTTGSCGKSPKDILESPHILKVFFDVRNDSDALHHHYGINLQGIRDVQVMESAGRTTTYSRKFNSGLSKCINGLLTGQEQTRWKHSKDLGERLWNPEKGGSYGVFNIRPLSPEVLAYCVGDVQYLPRLYRKFSKGTARWNALIAQASESRVATSQRPSYSPHGGHKALSTWTLEQNKLLNTWPEVRGPARDCFGVDYKDEEQLNDDFADAYFGI